MEKQSAECKDFLLWFFLFANSQRAVGSLTFPEYSNPWMLFDHAVCPQAVRRGNLVSKYSPNLGAIEHTALKINNNL